MYVIYFQIFRDGTSEDPPFYLGSRLDWDAWTDCFNLIAAGIKA